jgi:hypothetical protein
MCVCAVDRTANERTNILDVSKEAVDEANVPPVHAIRRNSECEDKE